VRTALNPVCDHFFQLGAVCQIFKAAPLAVAMQNVTQDGSENDTNSEEWCHLGRYTMWLL
jgi:hypothetical protein